MRVLKMEIVFGFEIVFLFSIGQNNENICMFTSFGFGFEFMR